jgi:hypothetical protein
MKQKLVFVSLLFVVIIGGQQNKSPRLENNTGDDPIELVPGYEMPLSFSAESIYTTNLVVTGSLIAPDVGEFKVTYYYIVKKGPSFGYQEYPTINAALSAITDNDSTHLYVIQVMPGIYVEDTITCKPYVSIIGQSPADCIVQADGPGKHCIVGVDQSVIQNLTLMTGYPLDEGWAAFDYEDSGSINIVSCWFDTSNTMMKLRAPAALTRSSIVCNQCVFMPTCEFTHGIDLVGTDTLHPIEVACNGLIYNPITLPSMLSECVNVSGRGVFFTSFGSSFGNFIPPGSKPCVKLYDGAVMLLDSCNICGFGIGLEIPIFSIHAPFITATGLFMLDNAMDSVIIDANAYGSINGQVSKDKVSIAKESQISILYQDQGSTGNGSGIVMLGQLFTGYQQATITNVTPLIQLANAVGKITGGDITTASGCQVHIAAGTGYVSVPELGEEPHLKYNQWQAQDVPLTASALSYVYVDAGGVIQTAGSLVNSYSVVPLGAVFTTSAAVSYIQHIPRDSYHVATQIDNAWREAFGAIYNTGSMVTQNITPLMLDVTQGDYFFSTLEFMPSGGISIPFQSIYGNGAVITSTYTVDALHYDNSNTFTPYTPHLELITTTSFAKHTFYTTGQGDQERYFLVYGQQEFDTLADAQGGGIPTTPAMFNADIVLLASLIVTPSSGLPKIAEIRDERPRIGFKPSASSGTSIHGDLLGLDADDHHQYLLVDGTRAMAGNLNMGTNALVHVGTVNGVMVEAHESRHIPGGADQLITSTPVSVGTVNQLGSVNAFSRSDHVHAHGSLPGGTLHTNVTSLSAGFMTSADKIKLDAATNASTPSTLVMRNGTGDFSAGTITANTFSGSLTGHASLDVPLSGGIMSGAINMGSQAITNAGAVTATGFVGPLTGIVTGTLTGAALLNVLKSGDTMTGALVLPVGTSALPSLNFTGSTTTGLSVQAANTLILSTAATTRMMIGSAGNITMNTPTSGTTLTVNGDELITGTLTVSGVISGTFAGHASLDLALSGGTMSGSINMGSQAITNAGAVTATSFVGPLSGIVTGTLIGAASLNVLRTGDTMTGALALSVGTAALPSLNFSASPYTGLSAQIADTLVLSTTALSRMTFGAAGNISIATPTSGTTLAVTGDEIVTGTLIVSGNFTSATFAYSSIVLPVTSSTTVGLVTQNGSPLLHTYGTQNIFLGSGAGRINAGFIGTDNIGMGVNSLSSSSLTSGTDNIGIGNYTLDACTTGSVNIAIGHNALTNDTTGWGNTALGYQALQATTTTSNNTAIGYNVLAANVVDGSTAVGSGALQRNSTGLYNTALGYNALNTITAASGCTGIGYNSLLNNTGASNTAIGLSTLQANTSGTDNTAVGVYALVLNTVGTDNTAVGYDALKVNTASYNTAVGIEALAANTSGTNNIAFGYHALMAHNASNNIAVGYNALLQVTSGIDNVAIGSNAQYTTTTWNYNTAIGYLTLYDVPADNNVAIGYKVMSGLWASGSHPTGDTAVGSQALSANKSGINDTAVGFQALKANTTATNNTGVGANALSANTASSNAAIGSGALATNTSGLYNTACGYNSLSMIMTVSGCTAVGYGALLNDSTGYGNTAVGQAALQSNTSGQGNTAIGSYALGTSLSTFEENTAVGYQALAVNTAGYSTAVGSGALAANTSGVYNTALGYQALSSNMTSNDNTAAGYQALKLSLAGDNTAVGAGALSRNTNGVYNSALGVNALHLNNAGFNNTALGVNTLSNNVDVSDSTAIGYNALAANTIDGNTAIGSGALQRNTSGVENTACGYCALSNIMTSGDCTAVGYEALKNNIAGAFNTACGFEALGTNVNGSDNTVVGYNAGLLITGDQNTCIGSAAGSAINAGATNTMIGYNAGSAITTENNVMCLGASCAGIVGNSNATYIANVRGVTTGVADAINVIVDSNGQLGTVSSSRKFKENIVDIGAYSQKIYDVRPVSFTYKSDKSHRQQYGLIAQEVQEIMPELVVNDKEGQVYTVMYQNIVPLMINELQKQHRCSKQQQRCIQQQQLMIDNQQLVIDRRQAVLDRLGVVVEKMKRKKVIA